MKMEQVLKVANIQKYYGNENNLTKAVNNISCHVNKGEFVSIMGASGSGKTTLLNCIATIDKVTAVNIYINGKDITALKEKELAKFRREQLGFIFQELIKGAGETRKSYFERIIEVVTLLGGDQKDVF